MAFEARFQAARSSLFPPEALGAERTGGFGLRLVLMNEKSQLGGHYATLSFRHHRVRWNCRRCHYERGVCAESAGQKQ